MLLQAKDETLALALKTSKLTPTDTPAPTRLSVVVHTFNPSTWESEAGAKPCLEKKKKKKKRIIKEQNLGSVKVPIASLI